MKEKKHRLAKEKIPQIWVHDLRSCWYRQRFWSGQSLYLLGTKTLFPHLCHFSLKIQIPNEAQLSNKTLSSHTPPWITAGIFFFLFTETWDFFPPLINIKSQNSSYTFPMCCWNQWSTKLTLQHDHRASQKSFRDNGNMENLTENYLAVAKIKTPDPKHICKSFQCLYLSHSNLLAYAFVGAGFTEGCISKYWHSKIMILFSQISEWIIWWWLT